MPLKRLVPDLTDLVYLPVCELIKDEALKVASNCVNKFQLDDDDGVLEDLTDDSNLNEEVGGYGGYGGLSLEMEENSTGSPPRLTLQEHIKRRWDCLWCASPL